MNTKSKKNVIAGLLLLVCMIACIAIATVRRLVEYIRVMKDKTIIIVLKGGLQIEEKLEQI